jgi:HAE1 family hydrophobic/amphiphilic exporter-1
VSIRNAVADVESTLLITAGLVVLVIFAFLKSARATLIPALALPVSLIATAAVMALLGYSIDNMSLLAITLSTGFVVDDAIVMLENIVRHIEEGQKPFEAAIAGAREIGFTILSMTVSLVAVFIPVLFMGGVVGRVFREFAVTISVAILVSGFVSLTLTPMLAARILGSRGAQGNRFVARISDTVFGWMHAGYRGSLDLVLRIQPLMILLTLVTFGLSVWLYLIVPKGFFPTEDTGFVTASIQTLPNTGFDALASKVEQVVDKARKDKDVDYVLSTAGGNGASSNTGRLFIALKPQNSRKATAEEIARRLRRATADIPGINAFYQAVQNIQIGGRSARADYQYTLQSIDLNTLIGARSREAPREAPGVARRHDRPRARQSRTRHRDRSRSRRSARRQCRRHPQQSLRRVWNGPGCHTLYALFGLCRYSRCQGCTSERSERAIAHLGQIGERKRRAARSDNPCSARRGTLVDQSSGAAAGGHHRF